MVKCLSEEPPSSVLLMTGNRHEVSPLEVLSEVRSLGFSHSCPQWRCLSPGSKTYFESSETIPYTTSRLEKGVGGILKGKGILCIAR